MTNPSKRGFSLMELLIVMAIIALIVALGTPVTLRVIQSSRMTSSADTLNNRLTQYQQEAIASNEPIEVRLYKFKDRNDVSGLTLFRAVQFFHDAPSSSDPNTPVATALTKPFILDTGVSMVESSQLSTLLTALPSQTPSDPSEFPQEYDSVTYVSFKFLPDGSTTLDPTNGKLWFVTVAQSQFATNTTPPPDYVTIQVDPYTGRTRTFRP
jgi:uncharacterized protein (TIGR02596 family)